MDGYGRSVLQTVRIEDIELASSDDCGRDERSVASGRRWRRSRLIEHRIDHPRRILPDNTVCRRPIAYRGPEGSRARGGTLRRIIVVAEKPVLSLVDSRMGRGDSGRSNRSRGEAGAAIDPHHSTSFEIGIHDQIRDVVSFRILAAVDGLLGQPSYDRFEAALLASASAVAESGGPDASAALEAALSTTVSS
jgi:hypothetical protein